jgi:hypothetical protein
LAVFKLLSIGKGYYFDPGRVEVRESILHLKVVIICTLARQFFRYANQRCPICHNQDCCLVVASHHRVNFHIAYAHAQMNHACTPIYTHTSSDGNSVVLYIARFLSSPIIAQVAAESLMPAVSFVVAVLYRPYSFIYGLMADTLTKLFRKYFGYQFWTPFLVTHQGFNTPLELLVEQHLLRF